MRILASIRASFLTATLFAASMVAAAAKDRPLPRMSFLDNGAVRLGVDLSIGGAITWLSKSGGDNVINNYDLGRQVQMSCYSGPAPYTENGKQPAPHWSHIGWNPIQSGDDYGNGSKVIDHLNDGRTLHTRCTPMQWPLENVPAECEFETWLELDGNTIIGRCLLANKRSDRTQYFARLQEMPAVYVNAAFHKIVTYSGSDPFHAGATSIISRPKPNPDTWTHWLGTEHWTALLNDDGWGLGVIVPGVITFGGGFAGNPGPNDTAGLSCGYVAAQRPEILDHNIRFEYTFELVLGTEKEIRAQAMRHARKGTEIRWQFERDRQGWTFVNASDSGWPLKGELHVLLDQDDPQLMGPVILWQAEQAPRLILDAAFSTSQTAAQVFWQPFETSAFTEENSMTFPIQGDGQFHRHEIPLSTSPHYQGPQSRLRIDPVGRGESGGWVKIKSISLEN